MVYGERRPRVLVTVPVHNEEAYIERCVRRLYDALAGVPWEWQVVVTEDGSDDGTRVALAALKSTFPDLMVVTCDRRLGRGLALRRLWTGRTEDALVFLDADLASGTDSLIQVVNAVLGGDSVVTGSRYAQGAEVQRPPVRSLVSLSYNSLLRLLFRDGIRDHQCGLKAFSQTATAILLPVTCEDSWFWDTEVLVVAARAGIGVRELPIRWSEPRSSRTEWLRLGRDVFLHGTRLLAFLGRVDSASAEARTLAASSMRGSQQSVASESLTGSTSAV